MATDNEIKFLGWDGTEQFVAIVKDLLAEKQDRSEIPSITATIENGVLKIGHAVNVTIENDVLKAVYV